MILFINSPAGCTPGGVRLAERKTMCTKLKDLWRSPECRDEIIIIAAGVLGLAVNINYFFG